MKNYKKNRSLIKKNHLLSKHHIKQMNKLRRCADDFVDTFNLYGDNFTGFRCTTHFSSLFKKDNNILVLSLTQKDF